MQLNAGLPLQPFCFGKLPISGDFLQSPHQKSAQSVLDRWLSEALLPIGTKISNPYPIGFLLANPSTKNALTGVIRKSEDSLGRQYPWTTAVSIESVPLEGYMAHYGLIYGADLWQRLTPLIDSAFSSSSTSMLDQVFLSELDSRSLKDRADYACFIQQADHLQQHAQVASMALGIGLLLKPLLEQKEIKLNTGIELFSLDAELLSSLSDMSIDSAQVAHIFNDDKSIYMAAFWLDLIFLFIRHHNLDLCIAVTRDNEKSWRMYIGFEGLNDSLLASAFSNKHHYSFISVNQTEWLDTLLQGDKGLQQAYNLLYRADNLEEVREIIQTLFIGEDV